MAKYSTGAIILHWLIALALAFQIALGFAMPPDASGFALFQLHKSVGIAILALTLVRLGWRLAHPPPPSLETGLTGLLAKAVHVGLYAFMVLAPLTGWAVASTSELRIPTILFGLVELPHLPLSGAYGAAAEQSHELLAWIGIALFALHVAGALRHQFLLRHALIERISPGARPITGLLLGAGVMVLGGATYLGIESPASIPAESRDSLAPPESPDAILPAEEALPVSDDADDPSADPVQEDEAQTTTAPTEAGPIPHWTIQPGGRLAFSVANAGATINGSFARWEGTIAMDPDRPETASIAISVDLASASLGDATQDSMLHGTEFFDAANFAHAHFRASSARATGPGSYTARGTLELKGTSRPQSITFNLAGSGLSRRVEGSATISRADFAIGTGPSGADLASEVTVRFSFDAEGRVP